MTYGVYTKDLTGQSISNTDLGTAKEWCFTDHVVCSEKFNITGFALHVRISKYWEFRLRPKSQYLNLGFLHLSWETTRILWADKIVYAPKQEGDAK